VRAGSRASVVCLSALQEAVSTLRPPPGDRHGPLMPMFIALTFVTGVVDAASYLKFGHVFVANMTGNIVFLGFALAGAQGLSAITSAVALGAFLAGAVTGGYIGARHAQNRGHIVRGASVAQLLFMVIALIVALAVSEPLDSAGRYALLVPMGLAMGVQNAAAQRIAVPELTTTVLTRTLTGVASEAGFTGGPGSKFGRRAPAVAAMLLGALTGALLVLHVAIAAAFAVAGAIVLAVALAAHLLSGSAVPWTRA
jgi:uncharacterized membrane protein YoaK (UPF0700 family)